MSELRAVRNSPVCFGCGPENAGGLRLTFGILEDGKLETRFVPRENHGGWEGVFHGGLMATLLDEAMLAYLYHHGIDAATAELTVRYRDAVRIGDPLVVHAWETRRKGRLVDMEATARRADRIVAEGRARCLVVPE